MDHAGSGSGADCHAEAPPSPQGTLVIRSQTGRKLSREQQRFNKLLDRVAELERAIAAERIRLEDLLVHYHSALGRLHQAMAERCVALAHAVGEVAAAYRIGQRQKAPIRRIITGLCQVASQYVRLDERAESLYDEWIETPHLAKRRRNAEKARATSDDAGASADDEQLDFDEILRRVREDLGFDAREAGANFDDPGERETADPGSKAELTRKSVRSVYLALAKVLHPDTVADAEERALREASMKQAALAYREGDLVTLLKLEMRWVASTGSAHSAASGAAVRAYLPALERQVADLEARLRFQFDDPRYLEVRPVAGLTTKQAHTEIARRAKWVKARTKQIEEFRSRVRSCRSKFDFLLVVLDFDEP